MELRDLDSVSMTKRIGLVSVREFRNSGVTRVSVTRAATDGVTPIFSLKTGDLRTAGTFFSRRHSGDLF